MIDRQLYCPNTNTINTININIKQTNMNRLLLIQQQISNKLPQKPLSNKTIVITGASRGIGLSIALRCARDGANIAILAKTTSKHPKLPGTIHTAAQDIIKAGGRALPIQCDIRFEEQVKSSIQKVVQTFGGIDVLINNASAVNWNNTIDQSMKQYQIMHDVILKGTFMVTKYCLPHLLKSSSPKVLNITIPPGHYQPKKMAQHLAYSIAKYGVTEFTIGLAEQFKERGIVVSSLWPKKTVGTAAIKNLLGGDQVMKRARKPEIMADAAYIILTKKGIDESGRFYFDEDILRESGVNDLSVYAYDFNNNEYVRQSKK